MTIITRGLGLLAATATVASAQPTTLTIDQSQSNIDLTVTIDLPGLGADTDSDMSPIMGDITIELDDYASPTQISINDFGAALTQNLSYDYEWFLSSLSGAATGVSADYGTPGLPSGPVAVAGDMFSFPGVPTQFMGNIVVAGDIFLVGTINQAINLAEAGVFDGPFTGSVTSDGVTVTINGQIDASGSQMVEAAPGVFVTATFDGALNIVASGPAPDPGGCNDADLADPLGFLDFSDVIAYLTAFGAMDLSADLASPFGVLDFNDVVLFLTVFSQGCP